ncbi:20S core proteasome subunit beta 2 [Cyanidioschyzon merolae strain 10D]|jgi:20S proteasome subunit beta 2|uniref:Proteasome subunit beta n=1 Tax=Cyanidioschyzon merolae (strain NIES-3377 / 10D) TaxID=280699 RepID=M1VD46_CYAM1|nr:20S core proteasome subunit beta 2 [Cyanidioschyzon merolae strain 10D]BAM80627.1 20S core proteasome subunit beta 2 [Cyanidioschyzon merolae strain 10D]|eukprot:XP_005536663.1 20S core proteasome subunit beta 2 [Cyanidioschyzon merolae strain 10D]
MLLEQDFQGFSFDLFLRNQQLLRRWSNESKERIENVLAKPPRKTGTTIAGVLFAGGVVLGADTRATEGNVVADKNCSKIHYIASNIYCCGAGTAADTEATTQLIASQMELHRQAVDRDLVPVAAAMTRLKHYLFRYQGYISAALVLGGVDELNGPSLYTVYPHGSVDQLPYVSMGSGSLAAMAVFEARWHEALTEEEAKCLVYEAISAGIENDLGSGSNVDLCVVKNGGRAVDYLRGYAKENVRVYRKPTGHVFARGTTAVLAQELRKYVQVTRVVSDL